MYMPKTDKNKFSRRRNKIKGVILAGGLGTRLHPITKVTNKHLLPVYDQPMIYYPLRTLLSAGIQEILIVTGPEYSGSFLNLLGSGKDLGAKVSYEIQPVAGGVAQALLLAEHFADGQNIAAILGDNIFEKPILNPVSNFLKQDGGARIFLKEVTDIHRFGAAEVRDNKVINIEEKPKFPKTNFAVTGLYLYDNAVFDIIRGLRPSSRGELEITDVNNVYVALGRMQFEIVNGGWSDAGNIDALLNASIFVKNLKHEV